MTPALFRIEEGLPSIRGRSSPNLIDAGCDVRCKGEIIWLKKKPSHGLPVSIGAPKGTKFAFSMLEAPRLESANSRTVVRVWQSWVTGFSRWQARQVRSRWQSKYRTDLSSMR